MFRPVEEHRNDFLEKVAEYTGIDAKGIEVYDKIYWPRVFEMRIIKLVANLSCLDEKEKEFFANFVVQYNCQGIHTYQGSSKKDAEYITITFENFFNEEQAENIAAFYTQYYPTTSDNHNSVKPSVTYNNGKLEITLNSETLYNKILPALKDPTLVPKHEVDLHSSFLAPVIEEKVVNMGILLNHAAQALNADKHEIYQSEIFESNLVKHVAQSANLNAEEKRFFENFDASGKASFELDKEYSKVKITLREGILPKKQAKQLANFYAQHYGESNVEIFFAKPSMAMYGEPGNAMLQLDYNTVLDKILPAIKNPVLLPAPEQVHKNVHMRRYK